MDEDATAETVPVTVRADGYETTLSVPRGANLRRVLLDHGFEVYGTLSRVANCGGSGLCGTCGVRLDGPEGPPAPTHWHDRAAAAFGYPRLSCQVSVEAPTTVDLVEKLVWGQLRPWPERARGDQH
jgi:ferredoxin